MGDVHKFDPVLVGEGYRFDPDELLDTARGQGFETLVIIGELEDGTHWISGTANAGETLVLMERAKHDLIFGDGD